MTVPHDDLTGAGISPKERLQRIEELLGRMDAKLDNKADASAVVALELRTRAMEEHKVGSVEYAALEVRLRDIETHGTPHTPELHDRIKTLEGSVDKIGQKLAYATGTLASVIVASNIVIAFLINKP